MEVSGGDSCRLEPLALMRESNLKVVSRGRCPKSPRPGCVDSVFWRMVSFHEVMNNNAGATKQSCNAFYTGSGGHHVESPITLILTLMWHCQGIFQ